MFFFETAMLLAPLWGSFFANRAKKNGHTEMFKLAIGCRPGFFQNGVLPMLRHLGEIACLRILANFVCQLSLRVMARTAASQNSAMAARWSGGMS